MDSYIFITSDADTENKIMSGLRFLRAASNDLCRTRLTVRRECADDQRTQREPGFLSLTTHGKMPETPRPTTGFHIQSRRIERAEGPFFRPVCPHPRAGTHASRLSGYGGREHIRHAGRAHDALLAHPRIGLLQLCSPLIAPENLA